MTQDVRRNGLATLARLTLRRTETRFLLVGVWNTVFGYLAFLGVYALAGQRLSHTAVLTIAYLISLLQSFYMQRRFVFGAEGHPGLQLARFTLVNTVVFVTNLVFLPVVASATDWSIPVVQAIFVAGSTVVSYMAHKIYSFAR